MKIAKYNISKDNNSGNERIGSKQNGNNSVYSANINTDMANSLTETHLIWGQPFNGTQDVAGDILNAQNISNSGDINVNYYTDDAGEHGGNITAAKTISGNKFVGVDIDTSTGIINNLSGNNLKYSYADILEILSQDITTHNLTVTGIAHFFELIIDKIKAAGGAIILSPADGFKVDKVEDLGGEYKLYWKATDGNKAITNMWMTGDQAICQTFNAAEDDSTNVSNKYYWGVVIDYGSEYDEDGIEYNFITLDGSDYDGELIPEVGDEIAMLGCRDENYPERQGAIYISAYSSLDYSLEAPFICQYQGINDFDLSAHKYTWLAHNGNEIRGDLLISSGDNVETKLSELKITADGLTSKVNSMGGWEYNIFDHANWTTEKLLTSKIKNTDFNNCFSVTNPDTIIIPTSMSFKYALPYSETIYVSIDGNYSVTIMYFNKNKKYLGEFRTYSNGENKIDSIPDAYFLGITINQISDGISGPTGIGDILYTLKNSKFNIFDTKITSSLIQQTANQIMLKVDEISIRIDNQKIVLDGNTEINGSLTLDNTDTGFILKGEGGETNISPKSIGTYSSFSATSSITTLITRNIQSSMIDPNAGQEDSSNTKTYSVNWNTEENLGYLKSGDYIQFIDQNLTYSALDNGIMTSGIKTYQLIHNSNIVKSWTTYSDNNTGELFNYTTTEDGTYKLQISIYFNCTRNNNISSSDPITGIVRFNANYSCKYIKPTSDAHMLIGYDGIAANFGNNKTVFIGKEESTFKYGNFGIRISSSGIQKYSNGNWVTANI